MKTTLTFIVVLAAALLLCLDDFVWPADCDGVIKISDIMESPMGRTIVQISVDTTGEHYGGDTSCANFAWCVWKIFETYPNVLRVEIVNDPNDWCRVDGARSICVTPGC